MCWGSTPASSSRGAARSAIGLVPSGDRTFYMRISGLENLVFFARMHGAYGAPRRARPGELLADVDLEDAARRRDGHLLPRDAEAPLGRPRAARRARRAARRRGHARPRSRAAAPGARAHRGSRATRDGRAVGDAAHRRDPRVRRPRDRPGRRGGSASTGRSPACSTSVDGGRHVLRVAGRRRRELPRPSSSTGPATLERAPQRPDAHGLRLGLRAGLLARRGARTSWSPAGRRRTRVPRGAAPRSRRAFLSLHPARSGGVSGAVAARLAGPLPKLAARVPAARPPRRALLPRRLRRRAACSSRVQALLFSFIGKLVDPATLPTLRRHAGRLHGVRRHRDRALSLVDAVSC